MPAPADGSTGTTVTFLPDDGVHPAASAITAEQLGLLHSWESLAVEIVDERPRP